MLHPDTSPRRERVCSSPPDGIENTASEATEHAFTPHYTLDSRLQEAQPAHNVSGAPG